MALSRRRILRLGATAAATIGSLRLARAEIYPTRPVHIVVGFPAGGLSDITARLIAQRLSERLGQPFVVDNRPGAHTNIATESVVRAPGDGYTLLLATSGAAINAALYPNLNFKFVRDIAPVASIVQAAFGLLVNPALPATTVDEFIAYAKTRPVPLQYGSGGIGSAEHLAAALFEQMAGLHMLHVPYRGSAPALVDLLSGQVQVYFGPLAPSIEHIKAGKLRALAVTTAMRASTLPDCPTVGESLPGFEVVAWQGLGAPRDTPADIVAMLNRQVNAALSDAGLNAKFSELGLTAIPGSPGDFASMIAADTDKWSNVVRSAGIRAE